MSANPKWNIVRPDRDQRSSNTPWELPADLQTIGDRLAREATELATRFPASPSQFAEAKRLPTRFRFGAAAILIGVAAGSAVLGWSLHAPRNVVKAEPGRAIANRSTSASLQQAMNLPSPPDSMGNSSGVQEVGFLRPDPKSSKLSEVEMLRIQLGAFEQVIHRLQDELDRRANSEAQTTATIESLSREIEQLRRQLQSHQEPQHKTRLGWHALSCEGRGRSANERFPPISRC